MLSVAGEGATGVSEQECPTRLLSDLPAMEDAFGPHNSLAAEIADLVQSDEDGGAVALEGGWGSGKSTVVGLLKRHLEPANNVKVMVFDAWAHQGDPLRRTFLETLITSLGTWLDEEKSSKRLLELAGRRTVIRSRETTQLTDWAKKFAVSLIVLPLGAALASMSLFADAPLVARVWIFIAGIALALAPLAVLGWRRLTAEPHEGDDEDDIFAPFTNRVNTIIDTETVQTPDPTSVEFERIFSESMSEALSEAPERRLVVVLDNLDRVQPRDALTIWSTMQTFLQPREQTDSRWPSRLWVLVPYDPDGIRKLWMTGIEQSRERHQDDTDTDEEVEHSTHERDERPAASFLDKSFRTRYHVPPPLLSNWHTYLMALLREALPGHDERDFHSIYRVYALTTITRARGRPPTPRDLKLFVNQLAVLHRHRRHAFSLSILAYYVALQRQQVDVREGLISGEIPSDDLEPLVGADSADAIAALYFSAPVDLARQFLLSGPIENALLKGAGAGQLLRDLKDRNPEAFWVVIETVVAPTGAVFANPRQIARTATILDESGLFAAADRPQVTSVLSALRRAVGETKSWSPLSEPVARGISSACELLRSNLDFVPGLSQALASTPIRNEGDKNAAQPDAWATSLLLILGKLKELKALEGRFEPILIPASAEQWIEMSPAFVERDPDGEFSPYLRMKASSKDLSTSMIGDVSSGTFSQAHRDALELTMRLDSRAQWSDLAEAIQLRVNAEPSFAPEGLVAVLDALRTLAKTDASAEERLRDLGTQGFILHHLQQMNADDKVVTWCAFVYLRAQPAGPPPPAVGQAQPGHSTLNQLLANPGSREAVPKEFVRLLSRFGELPLLMVLLEQNPAARLFVAYCVNLVAATPEATALTEPAQFVERWALIESHIETDDIAALAGRLVRERGLVEYIKTEEFDLAVAGLYQFIIASGGTNKLKFGSWCLTGLEKLDESAWSEQLTNEGEALGLALDLQKSGVAVELGLGYQDALENHAASAVGGSANVSAYGDVWQRLPDMLPRDARTIFRRKLFEKAVQAQGNAGPDCFRLYGEELGHADVLSANPQAPLILFEPLVATRNEPGLRWLKGLVAASAHLFTEGFDQPSVNRFKQRVRQEISQGDELADDASAHINDIAKTLNVRKSPSTR